jgi:hypothetical protein
MIQRQRSVNPSRKLSSISSAKPPRVSMLLLTSLLLPLQMEKRKIKEKMEIASIQNVPLL